MALAAAMAERRRAEAVIEEQKAAVEAANRTKDNFLAMLSHELRTPLTPVIAALEILKTQSLDASESKAALAMIRRNIDLESRLIDDLLDLTRIKGKLQLEIESFDAHPTISNVAEMCASEIAARISTSRSTCERWIITLQPMHRISADHLEPVEKRNQVYRENGRITISTSNQSPQSLTVTVADTGIGIEPETIDRIFSRFEQGDRSFQRRFGGLGLGLAISKSFAEAHGGTLFARSDGRGRCPFSSRSRRFPRRASRRASYRFLECQPALSSHSAGR
jgi:signal transduction histidine kinase